MSLIPLEFCDGGRVLSRGRWDYLPPVGMRLDLELPVRGGARARTSYVVHELVGLGVATVGPSDRDVPTVKCAPVRVELRLLPPDMDRLGPAPA